MLPAHSVTSIPLRVLTFAHFSAMISGYNFRKCSALFHVSTNFIPIVNEGRFPSCAISGFSVETQTNSSKELLCVDIL